MDRLASARCARGNTVTRRSVQMVGLLCLGACAGSGAAPAGPAPAGPVPARMSAVAPSPDPRIGLRAGATDAGQAAWNLRLVSNTPESEKFKGGINSDLSFVGPYAIQGSFNGFQVWNISNPAAPTLKAGFLCPASQSDVSVYRTVFCA